MKNFINDVYYIFVIFCLNCFAFGGESNQRNFYIDYERDTFVKDSKPFRYVSGSIHSYRVPRELWYDRLNKMWASGLNAIELYVFWNEHEPSPGVYDFEGQNDIIEFIKLAENLGFLILLRPGPYVCAEHDYGGLPWWLLSNGTDSIKPRTSEYNYMSAVKRWFDVLLPKISPHLYKNGGKIITVQIENEYGFFNACDSFYLIQLRDLVRSHFGNDVVYFTTDGNQDKAVKCGYIPEVYPTVDFNAKSDIDASFAIMRKYAKKGPLINSEFYPGWLDHWGEAHNKVDTKDFIGPFNRLLTMNANVNIYMFHGGTNFGFSNGANENNNTFIVQPTSYDYDAPINEAGDITSKFMAIRKEISMHMPIPNIEIPRNSTKVAYGSVQMIYRIELVEAILKLSDKCIFSEKPLSFEKLGQIYNNKKGYGFILYTTILDNTEIDQKILSIEGIRDRAYIQIGSKSLGVLYRNGQTSLKINLKNNKENKLHIIVENMGRLNFGYDVYDSKGILSEVKLDQKVLTKWTACLTSNFIPNFQSKFDFNEYMTEHYTKRRNPHLLVNRNLEEIDFKVPAIYIGEFFSRHGVYDTFLKIDKFSKGVALVGSKEKVTNLGRYWPKIGPQVTLYASSYFFAPSTKNYVTLIEFEGSPCKNIKDCKVDFIDHPIIDSDISSI